jgi:anthranilate synthase component 1
MMRELMLAEFVNLAHKGRYIAVFKEISAEDFTPVTIYEKLKENLPNGIILENLYESESSHYSFICLGPLRTLEIYHDHDGQPFTALQEFQSQFTIAARDDVAELITSSAGFITYDAVRHFENISDRHPDTSLPDFYFNFYTTSLAFDHKKNTILISYLVKSDHPALEAYQQAQSKINNIIDALSIKQKNIPEKNKPVHPEIETDISDENFMRMVEKAKKYISQGDAFQIVISRCFKRNYSVNPFDIYKSLRKTSPAPFMFYLPTSYGVIAGASPERFIRVHDKTITINPIAGTRHRSSDNTDETIETDLLNDKKELAEHMMLVDLARNDIGAVSKPGSIEVNELLKVKHYSHLSHITSTVTGQLKENYHTFNAFSAAFPAGTLSGAPKISAMQIIDELETSKRGLYGGSICRLDASCNLESCIAIRMAILKDGIATIRTGAGIVYDSDPASEMRETCHKAQALLDTIAKAEGE